MRGIDVDLLQHSNNLVKLSPFPSVFSKLSPENKLAIVKALQEKTHVVALTGDSVDDAPGKKTR
jgi:Ca2+-transporting ATPase